jgi:hypothetical protein
MLGTSDSDRDGPALARFVLAASASIDEESQTQAKDTHYHSCCCCRPTNVDGEPAAG